MVTTPLSCTRMNNFYLRITENDIGRFVCTSQIVANSADRAF